MKQASTALWLIVGLIGLLIYGSVRNEGQQQ